MKMHGATTGCERVALAQLSQGSIWKLQQKPTVHCKTYSNNFVLVFGEKQCQVGKGKPVASGGTFFHTTFDVNFMS